MFPSTRVGRNVSTKWSRIEIIAIIQASYEARDGRNNSAVNVRMNR
jgi:hypothetical protein